MAALLIGDAGFNSIFGEALAFFLDRSHFGNNEIRSRTTRTTRTRFEAFIAEEIPELVQVMSRLIKRCMYMARSRSIRSICICIYFSAMIDAS